MASLTDEELDRAGFTPGPWEIVPYGDGDSLVIHGGERDWRICFMATPGSSPSAMDRIEANAQLIITAPELLESLVASQRMLRATYIGHGSAGGSCSLCNATWLLDAETHRSHCVIATNNVTIRKATAHPEQDPAHAIDS